MKYLGLFLSIGALAAILSAGCAGNKGCKEKIFAEADIVVYGGTSAAVVAAVQAADEGKSVVVVSPDIQLGAMSSSGLGYTDSGRTATIGGLSREFYHRVWLEYQKPETWKWQKRSDWKGKGQGAPSIDDKNQVVWTFEPRVAEAVFENWIKEKNITVYRGEYLDRSATGVVKNGACITHIKTLSGKVFKGRAFIDCTFEGDLMAAAGCEYTVGREGNAKYGETYNGFRNTNEHNYHNFEVKIDPYKMEGDKSSGLLKHIGSHKPLPTGTPDKRVQAYCYRMCLTTNPANRVAIKKPANYNPEDYELLLRYMKASVPDKPLFIVSPLPNLKTDVNNKGGFSTDCIGMNYNYPEASYEERAGIVQAHKDYHLGLLYFIQNDARVPASFRERYAEFGLAKDEFAKTDNFPFNLYIREARRMVGEYVMTEADCQNAKDTPESAGMGSYTLDSHNTSRYVNSEGFVVNEGDVEVDLKAPYRISYKSITPKRAECTNLIVPVACSASHIAYGSIRMEPVFMLLAQSGAAAASMAIDRGADVQGLDYAELSQKLKSLGQVLEHSQIK